MERAGSVRTRARARLTRKPCSIAAAHRAGELKETAGDESFETFFRGNVFADHEQTRERRKADQVSGSASDRVTE